MLPRSQGAADDAAKARKNPASASFSHCDAIAAIDNFRFRARMPNRAAAVRQLLLRGLASAKKSVDTCHIKMSPPAKGATRC